MKKVYVNKKRLGVSIIIIGLIMIMFCIQRNCQDRMKMTSLMQGNIKSLAEYNIDKENISYKLPDKWTTEEQKFSGDEIVYHNNFQSSDLKIHGLVQVWNINKDLKRFLDESKYISERQNEVSDYNIKEVNVNKNKGFYVSYVITNKDGKNINCYEYFIKGNDRIIRFSFFVIQDKLKENMPTIFRNIVNTLECNKK